MNLSLKDILQTLLSLALGLAVFYLVYRGMDPGEMRNIFASMQWRFLPIPVFFCILSNVLRALRWNQIIQPVAKSPSLANTFCAVMYGYLVNHLLPRAGELARCAVLKRYNGIPFSVLLGTVVAERSVDMVINVFIIAATFLLQYQLFAGLLSGGTVFDSVAVILSSPFFWLSALAFVLLFVLLRSYIMRLKFMDKIRHLLQGMLHGVGSVLLVRHRLLFAAYSLGIFVCYYLMMYYGFWLFSFSRDLGPEAALTAFVFASMGMIVPVQGGIGAYEFFVLQALVIYGVGHTQAGTFAILSHLIEIVVNCLLGVACALALPFINKPAGSSGTAGL